MNPVGSHLSVTRTPSVQLRAVCGAVQQLVRPSPIDHTPHKLKAETRWMFIQQNARLIPISHRPGSDRGHPFTGRTPQTTTFGVNLHEMKERGGINLGG